MNNYTKTRVQIITGINPIATDEAYLVIAFSPENVAVQKLFDNAYEGDGAFYIATSDAWIVREEKDGRLWIKLEQLTEDGVEIIIEVSCLASQGPISTITIAVQSDKEWNEIITELRSGELPVILGPKP